MKQIWKPLLALCFASLPLLAGALLLEIGKPASDREALARHAVLVARTTACHSPDKTTLRATAEALVNGVRQSVPLRTTPLSTPGTFAVTRQWPEGGHWAISLVATNPDYKDYATSAVVPFKDGDAEWAAVARYFHAPAESDIAKALH